MRYRTFGSTGAQVSVIGQGTWNMEKDDRRSAIEALQRGLDAGMNHVDTAELYGYGKVEDLVGEAIAGRRDEVFLISKVLPQNASRRGTIEACERSLRHLRTDRLDCYLLHWDGPHPLADTIAAFEELREAGKIRSWGVSNFDEDQVAEAVSIAGEGKVACNQVLYHLEERSIEHAVLPYCEEHGIPIVAYSPFGSGKFPSPRSRGGRVLAEIAEARGATPRQIALAFLICNPVVFAIPKTSDPGHAADNAAAAEIDLGDDEVRRIDQAFPRGPRRRGVPTL
ncbi:MAG TPA: aldo/keto reductase [Thermoanaerobaculia bacterium]